MHDDTPTPPAARKAPLDRTTWRKLRGQDIRLLDEIGFLSRLQARRSARRAHYCTPGRAWLAGRLGCSTRTVSRVSAKLAALGVLSKLQRRPVDGRYQTNLYAVVAPAGWAAAALAASLRRLTYRLTLKAGKALSPIGERRQQGPGERLEDVIRRGMARFAPS